MRVTGGYRPESAGLFVHRARSLRGSLLELLAMTAVQARNRYGTHEQAEQAVKELNKSGFDMKKLSIVAKGYRTEEYPLGF